MCNFVKEFLNWTESFRYGKRPYAATETEEEKNVPKPWGLKCFLL